MFQVDTAFNKSSLDLKCQFFEFLGRRVAYFVIDGKRMVCLLQHTIYTKMKRLNINPSVCTIDQVRSLRFVGAIQSGVNRCKLIEMSDLEKLIEDCSDIRPRPGRPSRRTISALVAKPKTSLTEVCLAATSDVDSIQLPGAAVATSTYPIFNPLQFLTNFLPIPQNAVSHELVATAVQQHPLLASSSKHYPQLSENNQPANDECSNKNEESEEKPDQDCLNLHCFMCNNSPNENSNEYEKSGSESSSAKPSGHNSETDESGNNFEMNSFDREKSMSATDQDSGLSLGPSSSQGDSFPNSQSMQFLFNKVICLIETTESTFKSHCQHLTELSCELHKQINEILHRERNAQFGLYFQRQKAALYQRRYITRKFLTHKHRKRHSTTQSPRWNAGENN